MNEELRKLEGSKKEIGFTLLELLISIAITVIVLGAMYFTFIIGFKKWDYLNTLEKMNKEGSFALQRMVRELRQATALYSTSQLTTSDTEIIFNLDINPADTYPIEETLHYYRDPVDNLLMREIIGGNSSLLARNVSSFTLTYYPQGDNQNPTSPSDINDVTDVGLIKINLSLQSDNQSVSLETGIQIRNLQEIVK
ncbi:MAG TPA: prepilin-type N-terminal cleavage/methylation domain-containing protein [Candidatus Omnitrophica bacterium]|nr:prepilin-type N-terminal cleavage/methylation domain-containing protein [Candidatus Omnitrophota bacterium]